MRHVRAFAALLLVLVGVVLLTTAPVAAITAASPGTSRVVTRPSAETDTTASTFDWKRACRVTSFSAPLEYVAITFSC